MMSVLKKKKILRGALKGPMSKEDPDVLMDHKMKTLMDNMDTYRIRMEDKEDLKHGVIRNKYNRKIIGKIQQI